jgi:hypothetical protein
MPVVQVTTTRTLFNAAHTSPLNFSPGPGNLRDTLPPIGATSYDVIAGIEKEEAAISTA